MMIRPALLLSAALFALPGCVPGDMGAALQPTAFTTAAAPSSGLEQASLDLINQERHARGLEPMRADPLLSRIAMQHARDMERRGYYAHRSPGGDDVQDRHDDAGGRDWRLVAENIARCSRCVDEEPTAQDVAHFHERWMGSQGHRDNMLARGLDSFGFAAIGGVNGQYFVQAFSGPGLPTGYSPGDSLAALSPEAQAQEALGRINAARASAGLRPLAPSPGLNSAVRSVLPSPGDPGFDVRSTGDVRTAAGSGWSGLGTVYGACGACGTSPTALDIGFFVSQWLERSGYRSIILNPDATHFGFAIAANGDGKKVALATIAAGG